LPKILLLLLLLVLLLMIECTLCVPTLAVDSSAQRAILVQKVVEVRTGWAVLKIDPSVFYLLMHHTVVRL